MTTLSPINITENKVGTTMKEASNTECINSEEQLNECKKASCESLKNVINNYLGII